MPADLADFDHPLLGHVRLVANERARSFIFRYPNREELRVTCPPGVRRTDVEAVLRSRESDLLRLRGRAAPRETFVPGFRIEAPLYSFALAQSDLSALRLESWPAGSPSAYRLLLPRRYDTSRPEVQAAVRQVALNTMRRTALRSLPPLVEAQARQHGFAYGAVHVRKMHSRWGSCSSAKDISLSLFLVLLPLHLVNYVVCHELCHTVEMNHGPRFWQLLQRVTGTDPRLLRRELAGYGLRLRALFR